MRMTDRKSVARSLGMLVAVVLAPMCAAQEVSLDPIRDAAEIIPEVIDGHFRMPRLLAPSIATDDIGNGRTPTSYRDQSDVPVERLPESASERGVIWNWTVCNWAAANTFSNPRYFEDRMLERHGHQRFGKFQPLASGARFFATVPMLPYLMTVREPCDQEYTLGYYRAGSRTPAFLQRPPYERRAVVAESAAIAGAIIAFP